MEKSNLNYAHNNLNYRKQFGLQYHFGLQRPIQIVDLNCTCQSKLLSSSHVPYDAAVHWVICISMEAAGDADTCDEAGGEVLVQGLFRLDDQRGYLQRGT